MRKKIPRYLDSPRQLFFWEIDEVIPLLACIGVGLVMEFLGYSILIGLVLTKIVKALKRGKIEGVMFHLAHYYGVMQMKANKKRNIFENKLVE